jgi:hypothetical protein
MRFGWTTAALLAVGATFATVAATAQDTETTGEKATTGPEFQARDWLGGDGAFSKADFKGQVVLLEAWATT